MKLLLTAFVLFAAQSSFAGVKSYQVTGSVVDLSDDTIVILKGKERFEIAKDTNTKALGGYQKGDKATVSYTMTAKQIEPRTDLKKK